MRGKRRRTGVENHRLRRGIRLDALPPIGILQYPFDELVLVSDDERLRASAPGDIIIEQLARRRRLEAHAAKHCRYVTVDPWQGIKGDNIAAQETGGGAGGNEDPGRFCWVGWSHPPGAAQFRG